MREIQFGMGTGNDVGVPRRLQAAHDRQAHQATVTGNVNARIELHLSTRR
jgi:hypothetical protein